MLDKAQLSAAKIILGCLKTTSSNDVLADLNLTSLHLRREISLLCYVSKLIFDMVPCPFPASSFRSFKDFVPYALRHNQNCQIPLLKKSLSFCFFLRKASSSWNSLPLESNLHPAIPSHPATPLYVVKWRPTYTYSSTVTFTAQHEQHIITKFMIF